MTRWSLRRRLGVTQDVEREDRPVTAAPVAGRPPTAVPPADPPAPDQAPTGQPGPAPQGGGWFQRAWGRPAHPRPAPPENGPRTPGEPGVGQYGRGPAGSAPYGAGPYPASQYDAGQYDASRPGASQPSASPNSASQPSVDQHGSSQYTGSRPGNNPAESSTTAVLAPVQPSVPVRLPAAVQQSALVQLSPLARLAEPVPAATRDAAARPGQAETAEQRSGAAWPEVCDQFGLHLLVLAEQLRTSLDELEADEGDPERLRRLYQVDHAVTRMRRASRDLRTLAGRSEEELAGFTTSLLDVIRMATSAIERYTQVTIGRVSDLAVLGYAADDIGSVLAALLDNATKYSPGTVTVSGHLLEDGGVMFRIEDTGIGIGADQVAVLNASFAGPVPEVDERTGRHTGFPVVHRIARKHSIGIRLASRPLPSSGMVAMVTLPPHLLCEVPVEDSQRRPAQPAASPAPRPSAVPDLPRRPTRPEKQPQWEPPELPRRDLPRPASDLPRRERASLRGDEPRPRPVEPATVTTPEQQAAARRAFADELSAFSLGAARAPEPAADNAIEEEAKP